MKDHYAFVRYNNHDSAVEAIKKMNESDLLGSKIRVAHSSMYFLGFGELSLFFS